MLLLNLLRQKQVNKAVMFLNILVMKISAYQVATSYMEKYYPNTFFLV